ncbi:nonstructural protein [Blackfly microvirus SF02]|uniref:Nonstructural protein n=1 Tax=Blackfly microvirus SF02 TaxID=2576452 RepID=A0A4P8PJX3_9VIRU|nr:nonstructural protein [Blackfly microvirus SF02]
MILQMYSCLDKAVGAFMPPFFCRTNAEAVRSFRDACTDPKHQFNLHSSDFVLYRIGGFDDSIGTMIPLDNPEKVVDALSLVSEAS